MPKPYFVKFNERTGELYVDSVQLAKYFRENTHYILVRDNGKQGVLKYVYENGVYRLYAEDMVKAILKQYIVDYDEGLLKIMERTNCDNSADTFYPCCNYDADKDKTLHPRVRTTAHGDTVFLVEYATSITAKETVYSKIKRLVLSDCETNRQRAAS